MWRWCKGWHDEEVVSPIEISCPKCWGLAMSYRVGSMAKLFVANICINPISWGVYLGQNAWIGYL